MREFWERFKYEIMILVSAALSVVSLMVYREYRYSQTLKGLGFIGMILGLAGFLAFSKRLFDNKAGRLIAHAFNGFVGFLKRLLGKTAYKLGIRRSKTLFRGTDSVEYFYGARLNGKGEKKKKYKMPKWKDLGDNRSRVRFIYTKFLMKRIKTGWRFKAYETPEMIAGEIAENQEQRDIFDCYNLARYAKDCSAITDEVVARIKNTEENA